MPQIIPAIVAYGVQAATIGTLGAIGAGIAGAVAGGLVASALAPTQKSEGPRLGDLRIQSSNYGTVIPFVLGEPRLAGQVIWASPVREVATVTSSGGKGGGGQESTTYSYNVDLLILLTDNEQPGVDKCWLNGGLIWNKSADATDEVRTNSDNIPQWTSITVHTGAPGQLPDPIYEAAVGTDYASAFRGHLTVMLEKVQLGNSKNIPNFTFQIGSVPPCYPGFAYVSEVAIAGYPTAIVTNGTYAYVSDYSNNTIITIDCSDPTAPVVVSNVAIGGAGSFENIYVSNGYLYTVQTTAFKKWDISSPTTPSLLGTLGGTYYANYNAAFSEDGNYAFLHCMYDGVISLLTVAITSTPSVVNNYTPNLANTGYTYDAYTDSMLVKNNRLYIITQYASGGTRVCLATYNVATPTSPVHKAALLIDHSAYDMVSDDAGNYLYIAVTNIYRAWAVTLADPDVPDYWDDLYTAESPVAVLSRDTGLYILKNKGFNQPVLVYSDTTNMDTTGMNYTFDINFTGTPNANEMEFLGSDYIVVAGWSPNKVYIYNICAGVAP